MTARDKANAAQLQELETIPWESLKRPSNYSRRKIVNWIVKGVLVAVSLLALYPIVDMIYLFALKGLEVITIQRLIEDTVGAAALTPGTHGGLANAIVGTVIIVGLSTLIAVPIGVFAGVYLAEFGKDNKFSSLVRFFADVLAGVPSIILGYVGFLVLVLRFGLGFSALGAAVVLSVLMFPYTVRATELSLRRVPIGIKEGAIALGSSQTTIINRLALRFALPGILTGILLALSISVGETAPLLYTADFWDKVTGQICCNQPMGYLTYIIYTFSQIPSSNAEDLSYLAAFLLIVIVLAINIVARVGLRRLSRDLETRS
jgi:phosphate transport system permease protein